MVDDLASEVTLTKEQADRLALARDGFHVRRLVLADLDSTAIQSMVGELPAKHHLDGVASTGSAPILVFHLPSSTAASTLLGAKAIDFLPYGWDGLFGGMLTITAFVTPEDRRATVQGRVCIPREDAAFDNLKAGHFTAVFAHNQRALFAYAVDFVALSHSKKWFDEQWERVASHVPFLADTTALYWEILNRLADTFANDLTARDRVSLGWIRSYTLAITDLRARLNTAKNARTLPPYHDANLPSTVVSLLEAIEASQFLPKPPLDHIRTVHDTGDANLLALMQGESAFQAFAHKRTDHTHCSLLGSFFKAYMRSPHVTRCGSALPWADLSNEFAIRYLELKPKEFSRKSASDQYWSRIPEESLLPNWGHLIGGHDVPLSPRELAEAWSTIPLAEDAQGVTASADALLDEAVAHKKWTIPNAATVELRLGPFSHILVSEINQSVHFVCRTDAGEFYIIFVEPDTRHCSFALPALPGLESDRRVCVEAGIKLLLSAIVRDFWVVEERETVFSHRVSSERLPGDGTEPTGPRIVYLPRIRYVDRPNLDRCTSQLDHQERRAHFVKAHLRRVGHPSEHQLFLAQRYGFEVRPGYTFVRPHERGNKQQEVVYRSRSALQSLYTVVPATGDNQDPTRWFRFERDVYRVMAALGFSVEHIAASRRGDHGVDVFATKGTDLETVYWVIQCKCYGKRRVGPDTVRELLGVLHLNRDKYPVGTRGMIVTTSSFSVDAIEEAGRAGIRLMDGKEFARLVRLS
jgi:hypothetical protein